MATFVIEWAREGTLEFTLCGFLIMTVRDYESIHSLELAKGFTFDDVMKDIMGMRLDLRVERDQELLHVIGDPDHVAYLCGECYGQ